MTDDAKKEREAVLLPCPFCGGEAEVEQKGTTRQSHIISCTDCHCSLETNETFGAGALWNTRQHQTDALKIALWHLERIRDVEDIDPVWAAMSALAAIDAALKESK